jgi:hypothetical protein
MDLSLIGKVRITCELARVIDERDAATARAAQADEMIEVVTLQTVQAEVDRRLALDRCIRLQAEVAQYKAIAEALAEASGSAIGSLHVINSMANQIVKRPNDPNLDVVKNAKIIMAERLSAHRKLAGAIKLTIDDPLKEGGENGA